MNLPTPTHKELHDELSARVNARQTFAGFIKYMRSSGLPDCQYEPAQHHQIIIAEAQRVAETPKAKIAIAMPTGAAKSTYTSVLLPCWLLARDPNTKIVSITSGELLSDGFSRRRKQILMSKQWQRISQTSLSSDAQSRHWQGTPEGGGVLSTTVGSTILGLRADYLIIDDPVASLEESMSATRLEKQWNWYLADARTRLSPKGRELIVATRWSQNDITGHLLELHDVGVENWRYLRLPLLCDDPENDLLNRNLNEVMWPEWFTQQHVEDLQRDPRLFSTMQQQRPLIESGSWVGLDFLKPINTKPDNLKITIGCDIALTVAGGDFTVFAVIGSDMKGDQYLIDLYRDQVSPDQSAAALIRMCRHWEPDRVLCDDDNASKIWSRLVWELARKENVPVPLSLIPTRGKHKEERAAPLRAALLSGQFHILQGTWNNAVVSEFSSFPIGKHDDIVDAVGLVSKERPKLSTPKGKTPPQPLKSALSMNDSGEIETTMGLAQLFKERESKSKLSITRRRI